MTAPAPYVLMLGILVQFATGWPLWLGTLVGTCLSVGYVYRGGLRAIVVTDVVQFVLMYVAFLVLVPACVAQYGGWSFLKQNLPAGHLLWDGGRGVQAILVWYFIAMVTLVEPTFYQRCYAARSERTARRGIWLSILFWLGFDLLTTTAGLYARAVLPDLAQPVAAFPSLAQQTLAPFWQGLFFVGLLATIMSTVDSYAFVCAVTIGRDLVLRWRAPVGADLQASTAAQAVPSSLPLIRVSLVATAIITVGLALWARSVVLLWHHVGSVVTPVLLLPLALSHTSLQASPRATLLAMLAAGGTSLVWLVAGKGDPFLGVEAIFPGLAVSCLLLLPAVRRV
jgi:SSS family solute:Na+ symporter